MHLSLHAQQRIIERNLTLQDVESALNYGVIVKNKSTTQRLTIERNGIWVVTTTGWDPYVITVFSK
ncbi:DUF4258 domain-containing protein [Photobacterium aquae]|uniref:DUF4258 domain-containing protein n=1 Tax=Photobacterium aquae TaxID=1195763 RepID=UPI000A7087E4